MSGERNDSHPTNGGLYKEVEARVEGIGHWREREREKERKTQREGE